MLLLITSLFNATCKYMYRARALSYIFFISFSSFSLLSTYLVCTRTQNTQHTVAILCNSQFKSSIAVFLYSEYTLTTKNNSLPFLFKSKSLSIQQHGHHTHFYFEATKLFLFLLLLLLK